jgi:hypothetical protein
MDFVEVGIGSCSENFVACDVVGKEEFSIQVEEEIHIKDEIPETTIFPSNETEHEVRLWGLCV